MDNQLYKAHTALLFISQTVLLFISVFLFGTLLLFARPEYNPYQFYAAIILSLIISWVSTRIAVRQVTGAFPETRDNVSVLSDISVLFWFYIPLYAIVPLLSVWTVSFLCSYPISELAYVFLVPVYATVFYFVTEHGM